MGRREKSFLLLAIGVGSLSTLVLGFYSPIAILLIGVVMVGMAMLYSHGYKWEENEPNQIFEVVRVGVKSESRGRLNGDSALTFGTITGSLDRIDYYEIHFKDGDEINSVSIKKDDLRIRETPSSTTVELQVKHRREVEVSRICGFSHRTVVDKSAYSLSVPTCRLQAVLGGTYQAV